MPADADDGRAGHLQVPVMRGRADADRRAVMQPGCDDARRLQQVPRLRRRAAADQGSAVPPSGTTPTGGLQGAPPDISKLPECGAGQQPTKDNPCRPTGAGGPPVGTPGTPPGGDWGLHRPNADAAAGYWADGHAAAAGHRADGHAAAAGHAAADDASSHDGSV
ncbi:MAG TPA: hypothetical protein VFM96_01350 [Gaiellaceae bacterium]|nr:hypothetical protein [Gaiellaceae bacterium]